MTTSSNENLPWEGKDKPPAPASAQERGLGNDGTTLNAQGPRSSLGLGGGLAAGPGAGSAIDERGTRDLLAEGTMRAKNMAHALMMIIFLLAKYVAVKVVWAHLQTSGTRAFLIGTRLLQAVYLVAKPHLDRLREQARTATNTAWRMALLALIRVIGPAEEVVLKLLGIAKVEAAKLAARGTRSASQVLATIGKAIAQAIRAGLTKPAIQKLAMKVIKLLEDAQL